MRTARIFPILSKQARGSRALALGLAMLVATAGWGITALAQATTPAATAAARATAAKAAIDVGNAWTRATPGRGSNAAVYLRIINAGKDADTLNGVEVGNAAHAMLHATTMANGTARMDAAASLPIPAASTVTLAPGGRHIMLEGLKAPLRAGESFIITLVFAHAGKISTTVKVLGAAAMGPVAEKPVQPAPPPEAR